jgi:hypothetical protein
MKKARGVLCYWGWGCVPPLSTSLVHTGLYWGPQKLIMVTASLSLVSNQRPERATCLCLLLHGALAPSSWFSEYHRTLCSASGSLGSSSPQRESLFTFILESLSSSSPYVIPNQLFAIHFKSLCWNTQTRIHYFFVFFFFNANSTGPLQPKEERTRSVRSSCAGGRGGHWLISHQHYPTTLALGSFPARISPTSSRDSSPFS